MVLSNKEWLDKMDEIIAAIQNNGGDSQVIMDMLSNMWSSSVTYNVGDYALYNNNIWKCLVQNSNIAPTEGATWTKVIITDEISTLNSNLAQFKIEKFSVVLDKNSESNVYQTNVTYKNYALVGIVAFGATVTPVSDGLKQWYLKRDGTFVINKANASYGGTNTIYVTVLHD